MKNKLALVAATMVVAAALVGSLAIKANAAQKPIICKLQHGIPPGQKGMVEMTEILGSFIEQESNGRIKMKYFSGGSICPTVQIWNGVNSGALDVVTACTCYTIGKSFASAYFCNAPGSLGLWPKMLWYYEGGGLELARKLLTKYYENIVPFPGGWMMTEPWLYCNKEINSVDDLKGMKVRASGVRAKVFNKLGMAAMGMSQGEIMPAMERGVIDGFELATFWSDTALGTTDVADYVYLGDKYQEGGVSWVVFSKKWFNKLPDDLKKAVERACYRSMHHNASYLAFQEAKALHDFEKQGKIEVRILPEKVQDALFAAATEVILDKIKSGDKEMEELWKSQWNFYQDWKKVIKLQGHVGNWSYNEDLVPEALKKMK